MYWIIVASRYLKLNKVARKNSITFYSLQQFQKGLNTDLTNRGSSQHCPANMFTNINRFVSSFWTRFSSKQPKCSYLLSPLFVMFVLMLCKGFKISRGFISWAFFYYWLIYGPADVVIWQTERKIKLKISCFLFPPLLIFILIMDRNIKNYKKVHWYLNTPINFSNILWHYYLFLQFYYYTKS